MKRLFFIIALLPIATVAMSQTYVQPLNIPTIIGAVVPLALPIVLFVCGAFAAIFITKAIVDSKVKEKQAKYDMMRTYAERGMPIPDSILNDEQKEVKNEAKINKDQKPFMVLGVVLLIFAITSFLSVDKFPNDLAEFVVGIVLLVVSSLCFYAYYKLIAAKNNNTNSNNNIGQ